MTHITELIIKTTTFATYEHNNREREISTPIEHTYSIDLEGDYDNPTFTMPEDIDATQQQAIDLAVQDYLENHYDAAQMQADAAESYREDYADSIRKYGE